MGLLSRINKFDQQDIYPVPGALMEAPKAKPWEEVGVTGLLRTKGIGYVYDEWLPSLTNYRQKQVWREMRDNDAVIGAMFFALEMIMRRAEWRVEAAPKSGAKGEKYAQFVRDCMEDMSHTWEDFMAECVSMFAFGFALFETVYKRRLGPTPPKGMKQSRFDDGAIGWRKFAPRAQESILYWQWDDRGGLQGAVQLAAPDFHSVLIPITKMLNFRTTSSKNNPEGRSILRNCYRSWFFKRRIEEVEAIGIERDLCGMPVLYISKEGLDAIPGGRAAAEKMVRNIRLDDQMGAVVPMVYDENGNKLVDLQLLKAAGPKQTNPNETIDRYNQDILNTVLAGFVQFGQKPTGSRALHLSATEIFAAALSAFADSVAAVVNRIELPRLFALNKFDQSMCPRIIPGEIGVRNLDELASYVLKLSQSGLSFFDRDTADYLRKTGRLPDAPEESNVPGAPPDVSTKAPEAMLKPQVSTAQQAVSGMPGEEQQQRAAETEDEESQLSAVS